MDLSKPGDSIETRELGPFGDLPRIRDADHGRPYRRAWYLTMNPDGTPPLLGGPVGASFNYLLRIEPGNGRIETMPLSPGMAINEPVHVPASDPSHEGWLLCVVDSQTGEDRHDSELWVIDAGDVAAGPVARVQVPVQLRPQIHGIWVGEAQLARAAARK
jgi:carotenoid cleavage dioxygenase